MGGDFDPRRRANAGKLEIRQEPHKRRAHGLLRIGWVLRSVGFMVIPFKVIDCEWPQTRPAETIPQDRPSALFSR
jgi:hypothetical protein